MTTALQKNGYGFSLYPFFLCLVFFSAAQAEPLVTEQLIKPDAVADEKEKKLKQIDQDFSVLEFATPELSVRLVDQYQPALEENINGWLEWERKRLALLKKIGQWDITAKRIEQYLNKLPVEYQPEFLIIKASSQLKSGHVETVSDSLRKLLWSDFELTPEQISTTRQLLIHSYLAENNNSDARRAMLRYRQDYGDSSISWKRLQVKVLLATKRYQEAADLLFNEKNESLHVLKKLTRLHADQDAPRSVFESTIKRLQAKDNNLHASLRRQYWMLVYTAADKLNNSDAKLNAQEQILITGKANTEEDFFSITAPSLWQEYITFAENFGNKEKLLIGDDSAWFLKASNLEEKEPMTARALFAYLSQKATDENRKRISFEQLAATITAKNQPGLQLLKQLFTQAKAFVSSDQIPVQVRYLLLDDALRKGQIKQAANHFSHLAEPPEGQKKLGWNLRRARVLVLGGQYQKASDVLRQILLNDSVDLAVINRLIQVVFDFQKVDQHKLALELFEIMQQKNLSDDFNREIQFWKAESFQALKNYESSAQHYLVSAMMIKEKQHDPWAQTARIRAADVLTLAGLIHDARAIYRQLLKFTKDQNRKAVIKQKLQQLWLLEGKQSYELRE